MSWIFDSWNGVARVAGLSVLTYALVIFILRVGGNRTLAKTAAFDQVVSVALGSMLASVILSKGTPLADGGTGFVMLVALQFVVAKLILGSRLAQQLILTKPTVLLQDGRIREDALRRVRLVESDLHSALRKTGVGRVADAALVVLESDGTFSVVPAKNGRVVDVTAGIADDLRSGR